MSYSILLLKGENWVRNEVKSFLSFKFLFKFKYPKLLLFIVCIAATYALFSESVLIKFVEQLGAWSYLGVFFAGILFAFGFTAPFAAGIFLFIAPSNIFLAALIGGAGSVVGDVLIFKFVKVSFESEFKKLRRERPFLFLKNTVRRTISPKLWHYIVFALAGVFFASPLIPDEAAVTLLAGMPSIDIKKIAIISFVCNALGILFMLWI